MKNICVFLNKIIETIKLRVYCCCFGTKKIKQLHLGLKNWRKETGLIFDSLSDSSVVSDHSGWPSADVGQEEAKQTSLKNR